MSGWNIHEVTVATLRKVRPCAPATWLAMDARASSMQLPATLSRRVTGPAPRGRARQLVASLCEPEFGGALPRSSATRCAVFGARPPECCRGARAQRQSAHWALLRVRNAAPTSVREPALGAHEAVDPQAGRFGVCNSRADCREQGQGSSGGPHRGD